MKTCKSCNVEKSYDNFYKHKFNSDGLEAKCKSCYIEGQSLKDRLKKGFESLKPDSCECCGEVKDKLDLDHCHETGMFRGYICRSCNKKLSMSGDNYSNILDAGLDKMYLDYMRLTEYRKGKIV